jgi:hypothetical protein
MEGELRAGEMIEVFVISIGRVDGRAVFLVNTFDHSGVHRHRWGAYMRVDTFGPDRRPRLLSGRSDAENT